MRKIFICTIFLLWALPFVLGLNLEVEKTSSNEVLVLGTGQYATFDLKIKNIGESDKFTFYNLVGFDMIPSEPVSIAKGETKDVQLKIYPIGELNTRGVYLMHYFIRGQDSSETEQELLFRITDLKNAFELGAEEFDLDSNSVNIYLHNKVNFNFDSLDAKFTSNFLDYSKTFSLAPNKRQDFYVPLDKSELKKLTAGFYTINAEITFGKLNVLMDLPVKFVQRNNLKTETESNGIFINTQIVRKINDGNVLTKAEIELKKNIISRLFTSFNVKPDVVRRDGFLVYYGWSRSLKPSEVFEVSIKTNWILPFFVVFLFVYSVILIKRYANANLVIKKKITFTRAKGGEFALKVSIILHARRHIEKLSVVDKLPPLTKLYEKFGINKPIHVDERNRRIEWSFDRLEEGETRVLSYFIYSKIGILGKFALPTTTAIYERDGKVAESKSNRAFFVSEQRKGDLDNMI
jgi:hypothetical protein